MKLWKDAIRPVVVLMVICILVGLVLSGVNAVTAPVIAANEEAANNATYFAALPQAEGFTPLECDIEGVTAALEATNGVGYVITAQSRGYGGQVPAAVAFSPEGEILSVVMMSNDETPGLGQKVTDPAFSDQFAGLPAQALTLDEIDTVSGATISSKAALSAVNLAIEAYQQVTGGSNS